MVEGKVFIVNIKENANSGIWKSPRWNEKVVHERVLSENMVRRVDLAWRGGRVEESERGRPRKDGKGREYREEDK